MQKSASLLAALGDHIEDIKKHISSMEEQTLRDLATNLPSRAPVGSPEMVMSVLVYREIERRVLENQTADVLSFPSQPQ
ncbi:hypothetical protein [Mesorhizobium comanense]|uniref:hypothetical protein n=1 Tax=Mesorhizobium comanense TaxID=2502215 RepID=UPI0010F508AE|nr:hypothetical protein [Mesorhizobium comanense]